MSVSELLNKAGDHIAEFGHIKGTGHGPGPIETAPACIVGAVGVAVLKNDWNLRDFQTGALEAVRDYLAPECFVRWSDAPERRPHEVVEMFRATALIEAAKEQPLVVAASREQVSA